MYAHNEESELKNTNRSMELDIVREQAAFLQDAATILADLPSVRPADREDHTFQYPVLPLSTPYAIPEALGLKHADIDDIEVTIGDAFEAYNGTPSRPAYLSVDIHSGYDRYTLSRSGIDGTSDLEVSHLSLTGIESTDDHDTFINRLSPKGDVSVAELNALIASIALPNDLDDYSAYATRELQSPEAFESLVELLKQKAVANRATFAYELSKSTGSLRFSTENNQLVSFTLHFFDEKRQTPVVVEYDVESDFSLRFSTYEDDEKKLLIPTTREIQYARAVLRRETVGVTPEELSYEVEQTIVDQHEHRSTNELSGLVDDTLDELGLNPPNTGA